MSLINFNPQGINKLREQLPAVSSRFPLLLGMQILICDSFVFIELP